MEIVEKVLSVAQVIYTQWEQVKGCKRQFQRLITRIQILLRPVETLQAQSAKHISPAVEKTLWKLLGTLAQAQELMRKYCHQNWLQKFMNAGNSAEEFTLLNEHLGDAAQGLSLLLQAEQKQFFLEACEKVTWSKEDGQDARADRATLEELLTMQGAGMRRDSMEITEIEREHLTKTPWTLLMENKNHTLYKGEYHKFPVAIKVYRNPVITCTQTVREIFKKEVEALKQFESPHILRMYGICIDESGLSPCFSIIMEYCEKGTLRDVLTKEPSLTWKIRTQMALHASIGLYRLHKTGEKPKVHGCINSSKFLVTDGYGVKLTGFELCKTESSIKRNFKERKQMEVPASAYISPQGLASLYHKYDIPSEIYSFGIVLWEIVTSKIPFAGCTSQEIYQKVCEQHYQDPLGEDCPSDLRDIISQCRDYQPSNRPTTEGKRFPILRIFYLQQ
uniref:Protein kinase domain-containing protein n=1 Tax=Sphenodon punctatus TaxID=8508 RepID=A0A8D0HLT0_SPHPU